nr:hypothetical protein PanWU01x14_192020 [Ipomoea batatas]
MGERIDASGHKIMGEAQWFGPGISHELANILKVTKQQFVEAAKQDEPSEISRLFRRNGEIHRQYVIEKLLNLILRLIQRLQFTHSSENRNRSDRIPLRPRREVFPNAQLFNRREFLFNPLVHPQDFVFLVFPNAFLQFQKRSPNCGTGRHLNRAGEAIGDPIHGHDVLADRKDVSLDDGHVVGMCGVVGEVGFGPVPRVEHVSEGERGGSGAEECAGGDVGHLGERSEAVEISDHVVDLRGFDVRLDFEEHDVLDDLTS